MRLTASHRTLCLALALIGTGGCAHSIPRYAWTTDAAALAELDRRASLVKTVEAICSIALRDESGQHITLDGAIAAQLPDHLRMRAWKLQHPAFDITVTPDGTWIDAPSADRGIDETALGRSIRQAWSMCTGEFFRQRLMIDETRSNGADLVLQQAPAPSGDVVTRCTVDRATLTPRRYEGIGPDGALQYAIRLENHRQFGEIIWPRRITIESGARRISIDIEDIDFNGELNPQAFTPPSRAVRLP